MHFLFLPLSLSNKQCVSYFPVGVMHSPCAHWHVVFWDFTLGLMDFNYLGCGLHPAATWSRCSGYWLAFRTPAASFPGLTSLNKLCFCSVFVCKSFLWFCKTVNLDSTTKFWCQYCEYNFNQCITWLTFMPWQIIVYNLI